VNVTIDLHFIVTALLGLVTALMGWFGRELWAAVQKLRADLSALSKELSALEVKISSDYVRYDRLQDALKPIMETLHEIREAVARKVDK
jgi:cell division protein FtsB